MNQLKKAPKRVFLVAFIATAGLLASAAPGLAAEPSPTALPLSASNAAPASTPAAPAPGDDPDDEPGGSGGWGGDKDSDQDSGTGAAKKVEKTSDTPDDSQPIDPQPIDSDGSDDEGSGSGGSREPDDRSDDFSGQGDPDSSSDHFGSKKQTKAEKAAAAKASQKAKAAQKSAQKKAAASKKASSKKKQAAAKKMKQQAMKASKSAAARAAAQKAAQKRAEAQRRATAEDDSGDSPRSSGGVDALRQAILDLTNKARKSAGCGSLRYSTQLEKSAQSHANDMSEHHYMSHNDRQGRNSDKRIRTTGFDGDKTGENLGEGFSSPEAVVKAWMNSPSHRRNILDCGFRILGAGYASSGGYWVQHFGG
ncbi:CAP domain-containing protein [Sporichthya sp.]|uniref:CAP domain-containing protein n=1 Tax=Sporichthya sp. TaxID=65475 RepID=UPI0017EAD7F8|nr:CAP domain-containing protein [Sporichthya sp.]MBA3744065.1 hypothetical protein [Sporichthya sp.]